MNPFLKWVTAHRHAEDARQRSPQGLPVPRRCDNCHRAQAVPAERRDQPVRCEGCGVPMAPVPPVGSGNRR